MRRTVTNTNVPIAYLRTCKRVHSCDRRHNGLTAESIGATHAGCCATWLHISAYHHLTIKTQRLVFSRFPLFIVSFLPVTFRSAWFSDSLAIVYAYHYACAYSQARLKRGIKCSDSRRSNSKFHYKKCMFTAAHSAHANRFIKGEKVDVPMAVVLHK